MSENPLSVMITSCRTLDSLRRSITLTPAAGRDRMRDVNRQTLTTELVHDGQAPKSAAVAQGIRDEVHAPLLVRPTQRLSDWTWGLAPTFLSLRTHCESFLPVESLNPLPVHQLAFSSKNHVDHPVAARTLLRQLHDASP